MTAKRLTALLLLCLAPLALAKDPTAEALLAKYDQVMGPKTFEAQMEMTATREDGSQRTYVMKALKGENDRFRLWFQAPASVKGQEMLRVGDNLWVYLPNLKRATRIANRDSFQGGDFNNADVLRVNYTADYTATLGVSQRPDSYLVELKAKHAETSYDAIKLWLRKSDWQPVRGEYFGSSGQLIRSAEFKEHTPFQNGYVRPALTVMQNELVKARRTELRMKDVKLDVAAPAQRFTQTDLGR